MNVWDSMEFEAASFLLEKPHAVCIVLFFKVNCLESDICVGSSSSPQRISLDSLLPHCLWEEAWGIATLHHFARLKGHHWGPCGPDLSPLWAVPQPGGQSVPGACDVLQLDTFTRLAKDALDGALHFMLCPLAEAPSDIHHRFGFVRTHHLPLPAPCVMGRFDGCFWGWQNLPSRCPVWQEDK